MSHASQSPPGVRRGFTLVETLVAVGIIALLLGILLPALRGVRSSSAQLAESTTARQLMVAYASYANVNRDRVLPGYDPQLRVRDDRNRPIDNVAVRGRYPWRIAPYLDDVAGLFTGLRRADLEEVAAISREEYLYFVSVAPSLGLNTEFVGGDRSVGAFNDAVIGALGRYYVSTTTEVEQPDRLLVFTSARSRYAPPADVTTGEVHALNAIVEGNFKVQSPYWTPSEGERWSPEFRAAEDPRAHGYVSPRFSGQAVTAFFDHHVEALAPEALRDMRRWSNQADRADWLLGGD